MRAIGAYDFWVQANVRFAPEPDIPSTSAFDPQPDFETCGCPLVSTEGACYISEAISLLEGNA
jgi:hypothetical protein